MRKLFIPNMFTLWHNKRNQCLIQDAGSDILSSIAEITAGFNFTT